MRPTTIDTSQVTLGREQLRTVARLLPYLWPKGEPGLRGRVLIAVVLLVAAKLAAIWVPLILRDAVDSLTPGGNADAIAMAATVPVVLLLAYGAARTLSVGFAQLRDAVFARVAQNAIRRVALKTFRHLHGLSLRFHLDRQTGGLNRAIERGTKGIEFLLSFVLLQRAADAAGDRPWSAASSGASSTGASRRDHLRHHRRLRLVHLPRSPSWRIRYRRAMNEADSEANTKAIDSLLNYETVKYFGNEEPRGAALRPSGLAHYEDAAVKSRVSLSALNSGQAAIVSLGMTAMMILAAFRAWRRHHDRGRLRHGQRLPDAAGHAARPARHGLPRDQAVPGRHGGHVRPARRPARR